MNSNQKEEFRYQYAGMAMQAMVTATWLDEKVANIMIETAKRRGYKSVTRCISDMAVDYADALINALEESAIDNQTTDDRERFSDPYEECLHNKKGISL